MPLRQPLTDAGQWLPKRLDTTPSHTIPTSGEPRREDTLKGAWHPRPVGVGRATFLSRLASSPHQIMESVNGQACDRCHRRKTRCDKRRSACTACKNANTTCTYSARPKEPVYRRDYVERLERRARQLESNNRALHEQISQANQVSSPASHVREIGNISQPSMPPPDAMVESCQEAADTVSFLSTHAGSDRQFLGSASGLYLASLIRASIQQPTNASCVAHENRSSKGAAWSTDHNALPPRQMAKSLIDAYLAHDALCYPIVHPKQVSAAVENIYANAGQNRISPFHGFVFNMLLAIATAQVYKFHWQVLPDAETHHQRAMAYLDSVLSAGGLHGLQAMLLSCQFRLSSSTKDASGSLWHMVGVASRMCFELGLHRESTYSFGPASLRRGEDELLSISELEQIHRQCFWCVFCLDRVVSITLGRPLAVHLEDTDVALPSAPIEEREEEVVSPQSNGSRDSLRIEPSYRMAVFAHIIRYRALCGKILITLHRGRRGATPPLNERIAKRNELAAELEAWRVDTAFLKLPEMDLSIPLAEARSSFRSEAWYELLYQNGVLLLYRPSPSNASSGTQDEDNSVRNTHAAAKQSITLYGYLFQSRKINFSWITLHAVFLAGLSYVHAVSQHLRETRKQRNGIVQTSPRLLLTQNREYFPVFSFPRTLN